MHSQPNLLDQMAHSKNNIVPRTCPNDRSALNALYILTLGLKICRLMSHA
jgi:hypothetical protein